MTPSLETLAGLYRAAIEQQENSARAVAIVIECAKRHGFTEQQVRAEFCRVLGFEPLQ